jgi:hypothetical protein
MRIYFVPILVAPAAAVALYWIAAAASTPNTNSEWLVIVAFLPLVAVLVWTFLHTASFVRKVLIGVAMLVSTFLLWWLVLLVVLLIAGLNCPDDAYECPI